MIIAAAFVLAVLIVIAFILFVNNRNKGPWTENRPMNDVVVQDGVDVNTNQYGSGKGAYFKGKSAPYSGTIDVDNRNAKYRWYVTFTDTAQNLSYEETFPDQLLIGRGNSDVAGEQKLSLSYDSKISHRHCLLYTQGGCLYVCDLKSKNGTFLNRQRIIGSAKVHSGDLLQVGTTSMQLDIRQI